ncbi:carboxylesterase family protein [Amycolatopsis sp. NPDC049253]|uniref:carboxylesterase family protein n=1 Tax=Amycolatopsis sp. NPDC049253 TaxID=3155274 RepID=UPI00344AA704
MERSRTRGPRALGCLGDLARRAGPAAGRQAAINAPEIRTEAGRVRGRTEDGLAVFRGIPFARPPVGELRFAAPTGDGVCEAHEFGPPPPQPPGPPSNAVTGEDWLTLNVWSPRPEAASRVLWAEHDFAPRRCRRTDGPPPGLDR